MVLTSIVGYSSQHTWRTTRQKGDQKGERNVRRITAILIACALVAAMAAGTALAEQAAMTRVIIGFTGDSNAGLVASLGGEVRHVYSVIPAVAARVPDAVLAALRVDPRVAYVERDAEVHACDQTLPWGVDRIDADLVHAMGNKGYGIKVCIIDTGVDMNHPDLNCRGGYDFINGDADPDDDNGHGTHVAGIAAAQDNTIGVIGVAPEAYLYACKVLNAYGSGSYSDVIAGIDWARDNGMDVANMSLGGSSGSTALQLACDSAWDSGVLLVAAAGSSPPTVGYPAAYKSVMAVTKTDQNDQQPYAYGPELEVVAPGVNILSCYNDGGYRTMSGTSMATAHVSGHAALTWYAHSPWNNLQVRSRIDSAVIDLGTPGWDSHYGYGLIYSPWAVQ